MFKTDTGNNILVTLSICTFSPREITLSKNNLIKADHFRVIYIKFLAY